MRFPLFVGLGLIAMPAAAQDVLLIHGTVVKEDLTPLVQPLNLLVVARRAGDPNPIRATLNGNQYEIRIPANRAQEASIWTIEFSEDTRHPGSVTEISGPASGQTAQAGFIHTVDKVLLPENGPHGYERNIEQLLEYERLWYQRVAAGISVRVLNQQYRKKLLGMPTIQNREDIPEVFGPSRTSQLKRQLLWRKRVEVFRLYNVALPELRTYCNRCRCH